MSKPKMSAPYDPAQPDPVPVVNMALALLAGATLQNARQGDDYYHCDAIARDGTRFKLRMPTEGTIMTIPPQRPRSDA